MKKIKIVITILFLLLILIYVSNISLIPNSICIFEGEKLNFKTAFGIKTLEVSSTDDYSVNNNYNLKFSLFGALTLKEVDVNVIPESYVVPVRKNNRTKIIY